MSIGGIKLPKGFRFQPSDEELLSHYLELKNQGKDSEITAIIPEIDVCNHDPRDLPALVFKRAEFLDKEWFTMADSPDMQWYFFSPRVFVHSNSKSKSTSTRIKRTTEEGSWKKQGIDKTITSDSSDKPIGGKRILTFYLWKKQRTDWVIHEYYLTKANSDEQIGDYVLCRLKMNKPLKSGRSDHDQKDASNPENQAAYVIPEGHFQPGVNLESNGIECELKGLQTDLSCIDQISDEGQPDSFNPSDFGMVEELLGEPGDLQSLIHPPSSLQLQSPIYTKSGIINAYNDESRKRNYPFEDNDTFLTKKNRIDEVDSNTASNPENQAAYVIPEGHFQPGENLESDGIECELKGLQTDPCRIDHISDEGQLDSFNPSDFGTVEELLGEAGDLQSLIHPPSSLQLQSPIYTKSGELKGLQTDPSCIDQISDEGQPDNFNPSDFGMVEELLGEPGDLQSLIHPPSSLQLQSPIYTKSGIINAYNDESRKRNHALENNDSFLTKKNRIDEVDSNTASNPENQADAVPGEAALQDEVLLPAPGDDIEGSSRPVAFSPFPAEPGNAAALVATDMDSPSEPSDVESSLTSKSGIPSTSKRTSVSRTKRNSKPPEYLKAYVPK